MKTKGSTLVTAGLLTGLVIGSCGNVSARSKSGTGAYDSLISSPGSENSSGKVQAASGPERIVVERDLSGNSPVSGQPVEVRFTAPKAASLVNFAFNLAKAFEEGKNDDAFIDLVSAVRHNAYIKNPGFAPIDLLKKTSLDNSITLCQVDAAYNPIRNALDLLFFASLYSADMAELKKNAGPLFSAITADPGLETKVYSILDDWSAEHEAFYAPAERAHTQLIAAFKNRAAALKIYPVIQKIDVFTGRHWPAGMPFTVGLVPVPVKSKSGVGGRTYATAIHIPVNMDDMVSGWNNYMDPKIGIVVHEVFHSMFGLYMNSGANAVAGAVTGEKNGPINDLSEVLATAIGQGYVAHQGRKDVLWHGYTGVDGAAKEIYELFMDYLYYGKPIDADFMAAFLKVRAKYRTGAYTW